MGVSGRAALSRLVLSVATASSFCDGSKTLSEAFSSSSSAPAPLSGPCDLFGNSTGSPNTCWGAFRFLLGFRAGQVSSGLDNHGNLILSALSAFKKILRLTGALKGISTVSISGVKDNGIACTGSIC